MTFEEMQRTLEQMLAVRRELQESQLRQREELDRLLRISDRWVAYSLTNESEHLSLEERMNRLEHRMRRLEGNGNQENWSVYECLRVRRENDRAPSESQLRC